jgi:RNA polymerase sigma-70 factor (ECF subfamily)
MPSDPDALRPFADRAVRGDSAALRRVLEGVGPGVLRVVRLVLGRHHPDAEDAVQETLVALTRALTAFRGDCTVLHYACRIAVRTAMVARRRTRPVSELPAPDSPDPSPHDEVLAARRRAILRDLLATLPGAQAESMALRIVLGCSMQEVADATGAPLNTVRSRLRLAKEALARRISEDPALEELLEVAG